MKNRNESLISIIIKLMSSGFAADKDKKSGAQIGFFLDLIRYKPSHALKRLLASELEDIDAFANIFSGESGSVIVTDRNDKALEVLKEQIKNGKRKIGIFYGAAHMPDFEKKLIKDFNLKHTNLTWLSAWNLQ